MFSPGIWWCGSWRARCSFVHIAPKLFDSHWYCFGWHIHMFCFGHAADVGPKDFAARHGFLPWLSPDGHTLPSFRRLCYLQRMSTTSDGNMYFYVCVGDADLKFGVPATLAKNILESTKKTINKKVSISKAIENGEAAIAEGFRRGLHRHPKASKNIAPFIIACCLMSKEALENPDARAFILEISNSATPSWSENPNKAPSDEASGEELKNYAHYRVMAGRDEIDAFVASRTSATG